MKVITLTNLQFLQAVEQLCGKLDTNPDLIVEVLNAGGYISEVIKRNEKFKQGCFTNVKLQRAGEPIKQFLAHKFIFKILPYTILNKLRIYESDKASVSISSINLNALSKKEIEFDDLHIYKQTSLKNILIIDDAIDTGKTMFVVINNLKKIFPQATIKIAVISWTLKDSIVKPDFYIFKNVLVRFPWSKDYKGRDFEKKSFSS